jgi:hypothetical protein
LIGSANESTTVPSTIGVYPYYATGGAPALIATQLNIPLGQWHHLAIARNNGGDTAIWLNGTRIANGLRIGTYANGLGEIGGNSTEPNYSAWLKGYISNLRFVNGTNIYDPGNSTIIIPSTPPTAVSGTVLLTSNANIVSDASGVNSLTDTNVVVTSFAPFANSVSYNAIDNGGSLLFTDNSNYVIAPDTKFNFATDDFTVEAWIYPTETISDQIKIWKFNNNTSNNYTFEVESNSLRFFGGSSGSTTEWASTSIKPNTWTHVAWTRNSGIMRAFKNGVQLTVSAGSSSNSTNIMSVNESMFPDSITECYISGLRIVNGISLYNSSFTPAVVPPVDAGYFYGNSSVSRTSIIVNGINGGVVDKVAKNNVFTPPNIVYDVWPNGYLNFTGENSLTVPYNPHFSFGFSDFTIEFYIAAPGFDEEQYINIGQSEIVSSVNGYGIKLVYDVDPGTGPLVAYKDSAGGLYIFFSQQLPAWSWAHVAICVKDGILSCFINGQKDTVYDSGSGNGFCDNDIIIGNQLIAGINDLRISSIARYTENFIPPSRSSGSPYNGP